jgi:phenylacetate-CoA ligase
MMVCAALDRCFMAGLAYFLGGARLGMRMIRAGAGDAAQHWQTILATRPTVLVGVPSLFRRIAEHALAEGGRPSKAGITRLIGIGEPTRDASLEMLPSARLVEEFWGAPLYSTYASTEIATSFAECEARQGGHLRPELLVVEIVDDAGRQVPPGETGEVVVTPLGVRGMPLLRFRTGDVSFLIDAPCSCGRNSPRLGPILGRKNQMLKYKGTTIFPNAILAALEGRKDVVGAYVEARRNPDGTDRVVVHASVSNPGVGAGTLAEEIRARLRVAPELVIEDAETLNRKVYGSGKRKRATFFDLRREKEIEAE